VVEHFRRQGLLFEVDGEQPAEDVTLELRKRLEQIVDP
jgi:adenylate kinase family enzyme